MKAVRVSRTAEILLVLGATLACDQLSKVIARATLSALHPVKLLGGVLELTRFQNPGAFLGLGAGLPEGWRHLLFSLGGCLIVALGLLLLLTQRNLSRRLSLAGAFVMGGALGNQVDRLLFHGSVTDFLYLSAGPLHTGIFNFADMAILFGAIYFLMEGWRSAKATEKP